MKKIITENARATKALGRALGRRCRGGEVFALTGDLGAGKTCLIQGLALGLGVKQRVNSPTFNIWKIYRLVGHAGKDGVAKRIKYFCHLDAYRLQSAKDLTALGVKEWLGRPDTVTAIEWAEKVKRIWPKKTKRIRISAAGSQRNILIA